MAAGVHHATHKAVTKCDSAIHKSMYSHIVLSGGSTLFEGMEKRLAREVTALAPAGTIVGVKALPTRRYLSWLGGSLLAATLSRGGGGWVTRAEYEESGPGVVHRRCHLK